MKKSSSNGLKAIFWWIVWISLTIGSFFIASSVWTPFIAKHFGSVRETSASVIWVASVFGTWMIFLIPLIIVMYSKVDKVYEDARLRKEANAKKFRSILVDPSKRELSPAIKSKLAHLPQTIQTGHLVNVTLQDGRKIDNVFVAEKNEILGIYNANQLSFEGKDVIDIEPVDFKNTPAFISNLWLRLDGVQSSELA